MEPKPSQITEPPPDQAVSARTVEGLRQVYGPSIAAHFDLVRETEHWTIYRRRER
jgi:hypothetical protein